MRGPRFEQTVYELQPTPLSAMQMISEEPIRLVEQRVASCDGGECKDLTWSVTRLLSWSDQLTCVVSGHTGGGSLGHPRVFINLDKPGPKACG